VLSWAERADPALTVRPPDIAGALDVHRSAVTRHLQSLGRAGRSSCRPPDTSPCTRSASATPGRPAADLHRLDADGHQGDPARAAAYDRAW